MKADLLTYPLPFKGRFGLKELVDIGVNSEMDLIGIIGVTDSYDNPDHRWRDFWESRKSLGSEYKIIPYRWNDSKKTLTAFSVEKGRKKVTFLYGNNNPLNYKGKRITALRVGLDYFDRVRGELEDFEEVLEKSKEAGNLVLASPEVFLQLRDEEIFSKLDGVYWRAESHSGQEEAIAEAEERGAKIVPVSNAHTPYIKGIYVGKPKIGKSYFEFKDINWKNGEDLVGKLKEVIESDSYGEHRESVPTCFLNFTMALRKLPRIIGLSWFDYEWTGKNPVVKL